MQRGSFQLMKTLNKTIVLNKIRTDGPISRAQIAKETQLTPPTVGTIAKELIDEGIVIESALGNSQGGRKPTMLVINDAAFFILGIDAGPETVEVMLTDLSGEIATNLQLPIEEGINSEGFLALLKSGIEQALSDPEASSRQLLGIGVAMHGVVDKETGTSVFAPNLNLRDVPIKAELEKAFDCMIKVENDARAMALGEAWFGGHAQTRGSMMVVNVGRGVGGGLLVNGQLFHGEDGIAGEVGHMTIDVNGEKCQCGNYGCLQTLVSGPAISARARKEIEQQPEAFPEKWRQAGSHITGELIFEAAEAGNIVCQQILKETGNYLGAGLLNLIHVLNPSQVVLGGGVMKASSFIFEPMLEKIRTGALTEKARQTPVMISSLGKDATGLGAVALLLVELFDPSMN